MRNILHGEEIRPPLVYLQQSGSLGRQGTLRIIHPYAIYHEPITINAILHARHRGKPNTILRPGSLMHGDIAHHAHLLGLGSVNTH